MPVRWSRPAPVYFDTLNRQTPLSRSIRMPARYWPGESMMQAERLAAVTRLRRRHTMIKITIVGNLPARFVARTRTAVTGGRRSRGRHACRIAFIDEAVEDEIQGKDDV